MTSRVFLNCVVVMLLVLFAAGLRSWSLIGDRGFIGDEITQIPAARNFASHGQSDNTYWHHPPLGLLLLDGSIRVFGDNPLGWRFRNILSGSLSVGLLFLVAEQFLGSRRIALTAALMLAVDPLHIKMSGFSMDEIPATFFFLLALLPLTSGQSRTPLKLFLFSVGAGCSLATKSYYLFSFLVLLLLLQTGCKKKEQPSPVLRLNLLLFCIVPAFAVYVTSYVPWFMRGYGVSDFYLLIIDSLRDLHTMNSDWFLEFDSLNTTLAPSRWFVTPYINPGAGFVNNPLTWLPVLPAAFFAVYKLKKARKIPEYINTEQKSNVVPLLLFLTCYTPLLLLSRPIFIYSAVAVIPFAFVLVGQMLDSLYGRMRWGGWNYAALLLIIICWGGYLYPLVTGIR